MIFTLFYYSLHHKFGFYELVNMIMKGNNKFNRKMTAVLKSCLETIVFDTNHLLLFYRFELQQFFYILKGCIIKDGDHQPFGVVKELRLVIQHVHAV